MALKINNNIVKENIENQNGDVVGVIQFDPNDERIMKVLSDTIMVLTEKLNEQKSIGNIEIPSEDLKTIEEFENVRDSFEKFNKAINIEYSSIEYAINNFTSVFGKETMDIITGGSVSIDNLIPLIEFIKPYIQESRKKYIGKYTDGNGSVFK